MCCESNEGGNSIGLPLRALCVVSQVREEMTLVCHSGPCVL